MKQEKLHLLLWYFSDDEDDTAELLAELQRIKRDRAEELMQKVSWQDFLVIMAVCHCPVTGVKFTLVVDNTYFRC